MNVLMVGGGNGSWVVRAKQLGGALGARLSSSPPDELLRWADVVVLIKRADPTCAERARSFGKTVVWDALDFWQQPEHNDLDESGAIRLLHDEMARYRPTLVIGATEAMAAAAGGVCLLHHARPGLTPAPVRGQVTTVAYEGTKKFLGRWYLAIEHACQVRGWEFVINPPDLRTADLIVAFRDGRWDGWMCREWKSGVKVVNAIAAGRPIIAQPCAAMRELAPAGTAVAEMDLLGDAFDFWADHDARAQVVKESAARLESLSLPTIAQTYRHLLQQAVSGREVAA